MTSCTNDTENENDENENDENENENDEKEEEMGGCVGGGGGGRMDDCRDKDAEMSSSAVDGMDDVVEGSFEEDNDDDDNDDDGDGDHNGDEDEAEEEEEEEGTQNVLTQTQNELTQMADLDDCAYGSHSQSSPCLPLSPVNPRTLPWGRLIPCSEEKSEPSSAGSVAVGIVAGGGVGFELFPRDPKLRDLSGSLAPSSSRLAAANDVDVDDNDDDDDDDNDDDNDNDNAAAAANSGQTFLGISGLEASDLFNEYVLGRSARCDVVALKRHPFSNNGDNGKADWVHAMISNRHCRIYCMLKPAGAGGLDMEVFVEDTSGNGTLVNNNTLLHRGERRLLHTGDEICLINPATLRRRIRSADERKDVVRHYSYLFINVFQQRGGHARALGVPNMRLLSPPRPNCPDLAGPHRANGDTCALKTRRGMVDVRATNSKSDEKRDKTAHVPHTPIPENIPRELFPLSPENFEASSSPPRKTAVASGRDAYNGRPRQRRIEDYYDMRDLLGSGTCGEVRRAIHRRTGEERAVKIIATGGRNRSRRLLETEAAVFKEAEILQHLDHPYIVRLIDVFVLPGSAIFLVMEMLRGGDLFDRIVDKGRYTEQESRRIMRRMLAAVHYLHEDRNIVHRDLKPENILCISRTDDITVKLTDFGLAKSVTAEGLKTFCGTPQYFAPEVLRRRHTVAGRGRYGKEADMWSLGIILYILLSGAPPFNADESIDAVAEARVQFKGHRWQGISYEAMDMVRRLLVTEPSERMSVSQACTHVWILDDDGDTHRHPLEDPALKGDSQVVVATGNYGKGTHCRLDVQDSVDETGHDPNCSARMSSHTSPERTNRAISEMLHQQPPPAKCSYHTLELAKKKLQFGALGALGASEKPKPDGSSNAEPKGTPEIKEDVADDKVLKQEKRFGANILENDPNVDTSASVESKTNEDEQMIKSAVASQSQRLSTSLDKGQGQGQTGISPRGICQTKLAPLSPSSKKSLKSSALSSPGKSKPNKRKAATPQRRKRPTVTARGSASRRRKPESPLRKKAKAESEKECSAQKSEREEVQMELADDEIVSDFSDENRTDSIESFDDGPCCGTTHPPNSPATDKASDSHAPPIVPCSALESQKDLSRCPSTQSTSSSSVEIRLNVKNDSAATKRNTGAPVETNNNTSRKRTKHGRLVQRNVQGKTVESIPDPFEHGNRNVGTNVACQTLDGAKDSVPPDLEPSLKGNRKLQRTLSESPIEPTPVCKDAFGAVVIETPPPDVALNVSNDERVPSAENAVALAAATTTDRLAQRVMADGGGGSTYKGKQTTLSGWVTRK